jgi:HAD superfamily hydrolase (TIGR01509 family)
MNNGDREFVPSGRAVLVPHQFEAAAFDLDGVVTDTARVHAEAWTSIFNALLEGEAKRERVTFEPFTPADYRLHVDGRPRFEAIRSFLSARGVHLPEGDASDGPDANTIHGLAVRKNQLFLEQIQEKGVDIYPSTVALIRRLRSLGLKTAIVSASRNCEDILRVAGIEGLFDVAITGLDLEALPIKGKPAPDTFLEAGRRLDIQPARMIVIEDAIAGVAAGRAGNFGLTIGVDRNDNADALRDAGADIVVSDLGQIELQIEDKLTGRTKWGKPKPDIHCLDPFIARTGTRTVAPAARAIDPWVFACDRFDAATEGRHETLFALGNGYFVTRGAAAESRADDIHYPGTYLAGGYNRLTTLLDGRAVEHEDLVNLPNWLPVSFRIDDGAWFDLRNINILAYRQELDLRRGLYNRSVRFRDTLGRQTHFTEQRFVHMRDKNLAGQYFEITAEDWSGKLALRAVLDGEISNSGVPRYRHFNKTHFRVHKAAHVDHESFLLEGETTQSRLRVTQAARLRAWAQNSEERLNGHPLTESARVGQEFVVEVTPGTTAALEKVVALYTSWDRAIADCTAAACELIARAGSFEELVQTHVLAWDHLWRRCDVGLVDIVADPKHTTHLAVRLHVFHLLQTASPHTIELDAGVPARGWHGEGYRGHIFWDELFIFPFLNLRLPVLTRALLLYRYRRLPEAREAARQAGYRGAMFPWQSGSNGREETDVFYFNPLSGNWIQDSTRLQRHVGAAVAYNVWQYYQATGDTEFLYAYGAELMFEIARFWASIAKWNLNRDRYDITGVMGPDEFHDRYPDQHAPGLDNNAYTNVMASWCIARALDLFKILPAERCRDLCELIRLERDEIVHWDNVSRKLYLPFLSSGILGQFEGYDNLEEFDWEAYRGKYPDVRRLDLILEAEGLSPNRYKLSKQADVLMLFYLFSADELAEIFERLGYVFDPESIPGTIDYYLRRTSHGSTLSGIIHAWVLARSVRRRSWGLFTEALESDIRDIQGGTTREGIHLGAMAGTLDILQRCFTGLELRGSELRFNPVLPDELERLSFRFRYRGHSLRVDLTPSGLTVTSDPSDAEAISIVEHHQRVTLRPGEAITLQ